MIQFWTEIAVKLVISTEIEAKLVIFQTLFTLSFKHTSLVFLYTISAGFFQALHDDYNHWVLPFDTGIEDPGPSSLSQVNSKVIQYNTTSLSPSREICLRVVHPVWNASQLSIFCCYCCIYSFHCVIPSWRLLRCQYCSSACVMNV